MEQGGAVTVARGEEQPRELVHGDRRYWGEPADPERRLPRMTCMQIHQAVSARLDGEDPSLDDAAVYAHLAGCASCRAFAHDAEALHRTVRLSSAPAIPDLAPDILTAIGTEGTVDAESDTHVALRWILVAIGIAQIAIAIPALIFGTDAGLPVHTARHIGSFDVALGVGFLYAAWKPSRIPGLLPVVAALVACLVASSLLDVASGRTAALGEAQHLLDFVGLAVVWLLSRPAARRVQLAS
jgi:predicted anti-sigma-YlaC factor YlaD